MSRFSKVKVTLTDGTIEEIRGYSIIRDGVLHVLDYDGREPTQSLPLVNVKKYERVNS